MNCINKEAPPIQAGLHNQVIQKIPKQSLFHVRIEICRKVIHGIKT